MENNVKNKIEKLQKLIDNPKTTDEEKSRYESFIKKLEATEKETPKKETPKKKEVTKKPNKEMYLLKDYGYKGAVGAKIITQGFSDGKDMILGQPEDKSDIVDFKKGEVFKYEIEDLSAVAPKKEEPKKETPKKSDSKKSKKKGTRKLTSKTVEVDGKEYSVDSKEFCDVLVDKYKQRRDNAKKAAKKRKTTSVMQSITTKVDKGITQAIKAGLRDRKDEIGKNPSKFFKKAEKLEKSTKTFLEDLKDVMGGEFEQKEVTDTVKSISDSIDTLKAKFNKKTTPKKHKEGGDVGQNSEVKSELEKFNLWGKDGRNSEVIFSGTKKEAEAELEENYDPSHPDYEIQKNTIVEEWEDEVAKEAYVKMANGVVIDYPIS